MCVKSLIFLSKPHVCSYWITFKDVCLNGSARLNLNENYFDDNGAALELHGGKKYLGRPEVCYMNTYQTLCYEGYRDSYASFICKQLGFSPYG